MYETKDSEIEWIGKIPKKWNLLRIKQTAWLKGRIGWDGLKASEFINEGPYLITGTDFQNGIINWDSCVHISKDRYQEDLLLHVKEGDLLITKDGTVGKVAIAENCPREVSLNSGILIIRNNTKFKYHVRYLYYVLLSRIFTEWFNYNTKPGTTILHLYQHDFENFKFPFPPLQQQQEISSFLDTKCSVIDDSIAKHEALIQKLEEYRIALIAETVTKGFDPKAPIKESGINWIGEIPKHWKIAKIKFAFDITLGKMLQSEQHSASDTLENYLSAINLKWQNIDTSIHKKMWFAAEEKTKYLLKNGDVLITEGGSAGVSSIYKSELSPCYIQNSVIRCRSKNGFLNKFLYYWLFYCYSKGYIESVTNKATIVHYPKEKVEKTPIVIMPISEQRAMVKFLDTKCSKINNLIIQHQKIMQKLKELRESLIYNAVTGKIGYRKESKNA